MTYFQHICFVDGHE